jgi:hypothetical protein
MATAITAQSAENRRYVRTLLRQRQPEFSAALELAVELVAHEEGINRKPGRNAGRRLLRLRRTR